MRLLLTLLIILIPLPVYTKNWNFGFALDWFNILYIFILGLWLKRTATANGIFFIKNELNKPIAIFILVFIFSFFRGLCGPYDKELITQLIFLKRIIFSIFLFFIFVNNVKSLKQINFYLICIIVMVGVEAYICYRQHITTGNIVAEKFSWALKSITGSFDFPSTATANEVGAFFAQYIPLILGITLCSRKKIKKIILTCIAFFSCFPLVWSYSRGAWYAFIASVFFLGLIKDKRLLIAIFILIILAPKFLPSSVIDRSSIFTDSKVLDHTAQVRKQVLIEGIHAMANLRYTFFGMGLNQANDYIGIDTHNVYLRFLLEFGIFGFFVFMWVLYKSFKTAWILYRYSRDDIVRGCAVGFLACLISVVIVNSTGTRLIIESISNYFWILIGLIARLSILSKKNILT